jgi:hypothetical protein
MRGGNIYMGERATNDYQKSGGQGGGGEGEYLAIADEGDGGMCSRAYYDDDDEKESGPKAVMKEGDWGCAGTRLAGWNC